MPRTGITVYDLLISCPGDVVEEIKIIKEVVEDFNRTFGTDNNIEIVTKHWSRDSVPTIVDGDKPQEILNKQFVRDCDAVVAVFWTRFGTPTDKYQSGTEEEIEEFIKAKKQVFLYFLVKPPADLLSIDTEQYNKVKHFMEACKSRGIYSITHSDEEFRQQLSNHLPLYFLRKKRENAKNEVVQTKSIDSNKILINDENDTVDNDEMYVLKYLATDTMAFTRGAWMYPAVQQIGWRGFKESHANQLIASLIDKGFIEHLEVETYDDLEKHKSMAPALRLTKKALLVLRHEQPIKNTYYYEMLINPTNEENINKLVGYIRSLPYVQSQSRVCTNNDLRYPEAIRILIFAYREIDVMPIKRYAKRNNINIIYLEEDKNRT